MASMRAIVLFCCCSCGVGGAEASIGYERPAASSQDAPSWWRRVLNRPLDFLLDHGGRCQPFVLDALIYDVLIVDRFELSALACALDELSLETTG
jgi:hypothetical protein